MYSENSIFSLGSKIFANVCFWFCVALTLPVTVYLAREMGASIDLNPNYVFSILKYFDTKLFVGLGLGSVFLLILSAVTKLIAEKIRPGPSRNFINDAVDEVFSQLVGVGSIINVANIVLRVAGYKPPSSEDSTLIIQYGWLGFAFWIIAVIIVLVMPSRKP